MRTVKDISILHNVPVLVRAPLNEPIKNGEVANDFRLRRTIPTIEFLSHAGAKVIVCGHIGRNPNETLLPVYHALSKKLSHVSFCEESIGERARAAARALYPGDILMLENLRRHKGETENNLDFAKELSHIADIFVQDAFDTVHRSHASIVGVPTILPSYAGFLLDEEVRQLSVARTPKHPSFAIIGGAKFSTKEPVLEELLSLYESVFVGGALANDFLVAKGYKVGTSLVSDTDNTKVSTFLKNKHLILPVDAYIAHRGANRSDAHVAEVTNVSQDEAMLDAGLHTQKQFTKLALDAKTILWNGPLGQYENGFTEGTKALASAIAQSSAYSIVGGGDTITAIEELNIAEHFSFISTGGGAMLEFLTHGTLPGIEAILRSQEDSV